MKNALLSLAVLMALTGCHNIDYLKTPSETSAEDVLTGVWSAPAYGLWIDVDDKEVQTYSITSDYCLRIPESNMSRDAAESIAVVNKEKNQFYVTNLPEYLFNKRKSLPETCNEGGLKQKGDDDYERDPQLDFDVLWQTFDEHYAFFQMKDIDWKQQYDLFSPEIKSDMSDTLLFDVMSKILEPLNDSHITLYANQNEFKGETKKAVNDGRVNYGLIIKNYRKDKEEINKRAKNQIMWHKINDSVGYLSINSMAGYSYGDEAAVLNQALDQVLEDFQDTPGLIIDIRENYGGRDDFSEQIASRFIDQAILGYSKQARLGGGYSPLQEITIQPSDNIRYSGNVALLVSSNTVSAAEVFTLIMRTLPQVTVIGEATQGALSDMLQKKLPNGWWFTLSNEYYYSPDGELFEGTGIPPEYLINEELSEPTTDPGIEKALEILGKI